MEKNDTTPRIIANDDKQHFSTTCLRLSGQLQSLMANSEKYIKELCNMKFVNDIDIPKKSEELRKDADRLFTWLPIIESITFKSDSAIIIKFSNSRELYFQLSNEMYFYLRKFMER